MQEHEVLEQALPPPASIAAEAPAPMTSAALAAVEAALSAAMADANGDSLGVEGVSLAPVDGAQMGAAAAAAAAARRDYVLIDPAIRNRAIELVVNQNWKVTDAARVLGVKRSMLYKSVSRFKKDRKLDRVKKPIGPPRGGGDSGPPLTAAQTARLRMWAEEDRTLSPKVLAEKARVEFGYTVAVASVRRAIEGIQVKLLTDDEKARLREWAEDDRSLTHKALADKVKAEFGFSVSVATVNRALRGLHFSLERTSPLPPPAELWNSSDAVALRHEFGMAYMRLLPKRLKFVFVDEAQFSYSLLARLNSTSSSSPSSASSSGALSSLAPVESDEAALATAAAAASAPVCSVRTQQIAVTAAVMERGVLYYKAACTEATGTPFEALVTRVADALRRAAVEDAVIVLNAAYKMQALLQPDVVARLGHTLLFLPPDSPFLNPVEAFFCDWKLFVQRGPPPATERDLVKLIETCGASATADECAAYFRRMEAYIYPSVVRESILQ
ncbi:unnamed protein product [Globisporangium polare]